jgi:5-methyltetrahydropteroyltriglutamate--homocysteine methyltransferase
MARTVAFGAMAHDLPPDLPVLPTTVVGSYAQPSWFYAAKELMEADRFGPTDIAETFDDAVDRAVADQEEAGLDIISDGEMRRASFVWAFASRMTGLRDAGPLRKMGPMSLDMRSVQETTGPVGVPHGMGAVEEFEYVRTRSDRQIKVPLPGPFALTTFIRPVEHYRDRTHLAEAFVPALNDEIRRLAAAGCKWIQLDEPATPGYAANDPHTAADIARLFNACVEGVSGVHLSLHVCFGSFRKLPYAKKTYAPYFPDLLAARADQFVLEFATREMAEIEQWSSWAPDRELGAGIIDIRTHYCETPDDVAEKVRRCLDHVPAEKLYLTTDCGLRYVHRTLARAKITNLVAGVRLVRHQLAGS